MSVFVFVLCLSFDLHLFIFSQLKAVRGSGQVQLISYKRFAGQARFNSTQCVV
jgi:hypothetical protein